MAWAPKLAGPAAALVEKSMLREAAKKSAAAGLGRGTQLLRRRARARKAALSVGAAA